MSVEAVDYGLIVRAVAGDAAAERAVAVAMLAGLRKWFLAGEQRPIGEYLPGIAGNDRRAQKLAQRDYWLIRAHQQCIGATPWLKSVTLEREITRFEGTIWPAWSLLQSPPEGASELRAALFNAFNIARRIGRANGNGIPTTARRIDQIVKSSVGAISQDARDDAVSNNTATGDDHGIWNAADSDR